MGVTKVVITISLGAKKWVLGGDGQLKRERLSRAICRTRRCLFV